MSDDQLKQKIEQAVESAKEQIIETLCTVLRFKTVSGAADEEGKTNFREQTRQCFEYLEKTSGSMGLEWRNYDNRLGIIDLAGGERFVGLPVHTDVVPVEEGWTHAPFDGVVADDFVWGRGCQDDKGPLVQLLYAVKTLKDLGLKLQRGARIIIGTEEEGGDWEDIKSYKTVEPLPEISVVSDAQFPIINGEKGMLNLNISTKLAADDPEDDELRFTSASAGERANIVPARAELVFTGKSDNTQLKKELDRFVAGQQGSTAEVIENDNEFIIVFHGKAAHGSTPSEGLNAALDLLLFMTQSAFVTDDEADLAQFLYDCGVDLNGKKLNINAHHHFIGATTVNLGLLRWNAGSVMTTYNIRQTLGITAEETVRRASEVAAEFADETGFEIHVAKSGRTMEPIYVDPAKHPEFIGALKEAYTTFTGRDAVLTSIGGTTYAKVFPNAVCFGPVDPAEETELAHQTDERVKVDHVLRNVKIYAYALARLCAAD